MLENKDAGSPDGGKSNVIMTVGESPAGHNMVQATTGIISAATTGQQQPDPNIVKIVINYPEKWKKEKFFKDGDVKEVARETAEKFIKAGIAKMVEENEAE